MSVASMKARFREAPERVMISVHRGLWDPAPENSLPAIRGAAAWDVVEVDLRIDAAGNTYLMHDDTLDRMAGHSAETSGADPDLLRSLRLREGAGGETPMTDSAVPYLPEAASVIAGTDAIFDYDVKRAEDVVHVANELARRGLSDTGTLKIDVAGPDDIETLKKIEAETGVMVMAKVNLDRPEALDVILALAEADQAAVEAFFTSLPLLAEACRIGGSDLRLGVFTLDGIHCCGMSDSAALADADAIWGALIDAGVGLIMTDEPETLTEYLANRSL